MSPGNYTVLSQKPGLARDLLCPGAMNDRAPQERPSFATISGVPVV